ncbi:hypothetical protein OG462_44055 [Streptomyces sp. NBC_01077]|uniref:hypothetical protein n=1 Tax=Streptomyces sp. NBC_01077 TaxID=2903746 RepID=UPI003862ECBD|nr:hypothetical protein OG462_00950 [Streptomyces sp. NBC_01077]WSV43706.1 hypothetical protein OG462_44055 [Streptomyces sp. NBC_01077]
MAVSISEDQLVLRVGACCRAPWSRREPILMPSMPQRAKLGDEFSDHVGRQPRVLSTPDDRRTAQFPTAQAMITASAHAAGAKFLAAAEGDVRRFGTADRPAGLAGSPWCPETGAMSAAT